MDEKTILRNEVQQIFFGFSVTDLTENYTIKIINSIDRTFHLFEATMLEQSPQDVESIKRGIQNLRNLYIEQAKASAQQLETEFEKIFNIPNNVPLPIVGSTNVNVTDIDIKNELQDVTLLRDQLLQERVFLAKLEERKTFFNNNVKIMIDRVKKLLSLSAVNSLSSKDGLQELIETLKKALIEKND